MSASVGANRVEHGSGTKGSIGAEQRAEGEVGHEAAHAVSAAAAAAALGVVPEHGLSDEEVERRRARYGKNVLPSVRARAAWRILASQFESLVVGLLAAAALVAWARGDAMDAVAIVTVLFLNATTGFFTEWRAVRALDALRKEAHVVARVRRDGRERAVKAQEVVPGDVVIVNAGDSVPADMRVIDAASLRTQESALTGESTVVEKSPAPAQAATPLADRHCMLYLGTMVVAGRGVAVVVATGTTTELGRIGLLVADAPEEKAPLEKRLAQLGKRLVYVVLGIAAVVTLAGWLRGDEFWGMVEVGISLAVAAVPEGLPAVTTLTLALGVLRMARNRAIVRRLAAVETLGSATVICTDKTGTLTENRMTVREYRLSDGTTVVLDGNRIDPRSNPLLARALRAGVLCNEASFHSESQAAPHTVGDPTETALLMAAHVLGLDVPRERACCPKVDERPFDASTMRMITLHTTIGDGRRVAILKGAPAAVLDRCVAYAGAGEKPCVLDGARRERFLDVNREMADRALRVLALADKQLAPSDEAGDLETGYVFLGFVGMIDPPRPEAADAIRSARAAGVRTIMLTGDQLNTARAIARELDFGEGGSPRAFHALDLRDVTSERLLEMARTADVFARVSPEDKLNIVEALQRSGEIVAVTGDGVNDAPALKRADIGIAMGERGTEAAKEVADVVLADDDFATIIRAIEGGRTIYANIIKFVHLMFTHNAGEVLTIFIAIAVGWPLPLLPLQILWINLVTDVFPALALALEPPAPDVMRRAPRSPRAPLLSGRFLLLIAWQGAMLAAISLAAYYWALVSYGPGAHARTIALLSLVAVQAGHLFNCRSRSRSAFSGLFENPFIWLASGVAIGLQTLALYFAPLARVLDTVVPNQQDWTVATIVMLAPIAIVEASKVIARANRARTTYETSPIGSTR